MLELVDNEIISLLIITMYLKEESMKINSSKI